MTIVDSKLVDKNQIRNLFLKVVEETAEVNPAFMNWGETSITEALRSNQFLLLQSEHGKLGSFICYQQVADWVEILALGTLMESQRKGHLKVLLASLVKKCSTTSKFLTLEVHSLNHNAIALYRHCDFKTVRIRKNYYSDGHDAMVMDLVFKGSSH